MIHEYLQLRRLGYEVRIVTFKYHPRATFEFREEVEKGLFVCRGALWPARLLSAWRFLRKFGCDVIILTSGTVELFVLSKTSRIPYLAHHHQPSSMANEGYDKYCSLMKEHFDWLCSRTENGKMFYAIRGNRPWRTKLMHEILGRIYKSVMDNAHAVLVMSAYAKIEAEVLFSSPVKNIQGALDENFRATHRDIPPLLDKGNPVILTVARLAPNKRIGLGIEAFAEFRHRFPGARYYIVGSGPREAELRAMIDRLKLGGSCVLVGQVEELEMRRWYRTCDLFVTVDWADFRITAFEAWAAGRPVVLSNEAEVNEDLAATGYVITASPNPLAIAEAMEAALIDTRQSDPEQLATVLDRYTWRTYVEAVARELP